MRNAQLAVLFLDLCVGCSRVDEPAKRRAPTTTSGDAVAQPKPVDTGYPESEQVLGLVHRALDLKRDGQFQEALRLVDKALALDPHSPTATKLRHQLVNIIVKIRRRKHDVAAEQVTVSDSNPVDLVD